MSRHASPVKYKQMEKTITKHEWAYIGNGMAKCLNCPTWREEKRDGILYKQGNKKPVKKEPPCITRKIQTDEDSTRMEA